jgi:hypothetical protein
LHTTPFLADRYRLTIIAGKVIKHHQIIYYRD